MADSRTFDDLTLASLPTPPRRAIWLPVLILAVGLVLAAVIRPSGVFDPPWLLTTLNLVFLTAVPLAAAGLAIPAYRRTGVGALLALGTGMLATAVGNGIVPALLLVFASPNASVSVHNSAALLGGACHLAGAIAGVIGITTGRRRGRHVAIAYALVAALIGVWIVIVLLGATPAFFTADGSTGLRLAVLRVAASVYVLAAFSWWQTLVRDRSIRFLGWYVPGLVMVGISIIGLVGQGEIGSALGWFSRAGQYLGATYMLVAVARETLPLGSPRRDAALGVALLQAALPFRPLVERTTDAVLAIGARGRIVYWNDAARVLFGYPADEAFDQDPVDLLAARDAVPDVRPVLRALIDGDREGTDSIGRAEITLRDRAGRPFPAEVTVFANPDDSRVRVCVVRDVSDAVRYRDELERRVQERTAKLESANAALETANAALEAANAAKDEFLGLVSHELKTPITTMVGTAALLERRGADDRDDLLADLSGEASRLARIVDNLLALARLESGRAGEREPVALDHLVRAVVGDVRREFRDRTIDLDVQLGVIVEANPEQLAMVIRNYVANALKYSPTTATVDVVVRSERGWACVDVLDQGVGIEEKDSLTLFEPFYRSPRTSATPGIGIGLTVCRRIIESLGGEVRASRRPDGPGSVFSFELPLATTDPGDA